MPHTVSPKPAASQSGFTVIHLLITLAIVAVVVAALVPFVRRVLATANDTNAQTDLITIGKAQFALHDSSGTYASSLTQLTTLPPGLAAGESSGHRFRIVASSRDTFLVEAAPVKPGVSGYKTCTINHQLTIGC